MTIPKIIHQVWFTMNGGPTTPPEKYLKLHEEWKRKHPGWKIIIWSTETSDEFMRTHYPNYLRLYYGLPKEINRIDMFRYHVLYHYGGFYIDMDTNPGPKSLEELVSHDLVMVRDKIHAFGYTNAFLGSSARHSYMKALMDANPGTNAAVYPILATGPRFISEIHGKGNYKTFALDEFECTHYVNHHCDSTWANQSVHKVVGPVIQSFSKLYGIVSGKKKNAAQ